MTNLSSRRPFISKKNGCAYLAKFSLNNENIKVNSNAEKWHTIFHHCQPPYTFDLSEISALAYAPQCNIRIHYFSAGYGIYTIIE